MRIGIVMGLLAGVGITLVGCGESDLSAGDPDGSAYTSTRVSGRELVAGTAIKLRFDDGRLAVSAGCNTMGGPYELEADRLWWTGEQESTLVGCPDDLVAQDEWLSDLLTDGVEADFDGGDLTLTSDEVTIELAEE